MKLRTLVLQSKLRLTTLATQLRVTVGEFIAALIPLDNISISEIFTKQVGKNIEENPHLTDTPVATLYKTNPESVSIGDGTDGVYFAEDYVIGAPSNQTYTLSGGFYWSISKPQQEPLAVSDGLLSKQLGKNLSDGIVVTEQISGVSPLDEAIDDAPAVADIKVIAFSKYVDDAAGTTDTAAINFGKRSADAAAVGDSVDSFSVAKALSETTTTADNTVVDFSKVASDTTSATDSKVISISRALSDATGAVDSSVNTLNKNVSDTSGTTDSNVIDFNKRPSDTASANDSVIYRSVSKAVSEAAVVSSSGSLRMQDYTVDMSYFAEDYVGSSRAFM